MALASRRCLTTLTHHGASLLSHLQCLKPPTPSRSLYDSSPIERDWSDPNTLLPRFDLKEEREKAILGYKFNSLEIPPPWEVQTEKEKKEEKKKEPRRQSFQPSVFFYVRFFFFWERNNFLGLNLCLFIVFCSGLVSCVFCLSNVVWWVIFWFWIMVLGWEAAL